MSDLQIGLIVLGVALIGVVLGFNCWQDRRVRRRMETHFPSGEHDPLLGEAHSSEPRVASAGAAPAAIRREPCMTAAEAQVQQVPTLAISLEPKGGVPSERGPTGPVLFKGELIKRML